MTAPLNPFSKLCRVFFAPWIAASPIQCVPKPPMASVGFVAAQRDQIRRVEFVFWCDVNRYFVMDFRIVRCAARFAGWTIDEMFATYLFPT